MEHCESQNTFGETQSAYRKHLCTTDNLIKLVQHVSEAFQWSEIVRFGCLDVKKALNKVHTITVQVQLQQLYIFFHEAFLPAIKLQQKSNVLTRRKVVQWLTGVKESTEEQFSPTAVRVQLSYLQLSYYLFFSGTKRNTI